MHEAERLLAPPEAGKHECRLRAPREVGGIDDSERTEPGARGEQVVERLGEAALGGAQDAAAAADIRPLPDAGILFALFGVIEVARGTPEVPAGYVCLAEREQRGVKSEQCRRRFALEPDRVRARVLS
ncbi:MAG: hypothetical protein M3433_03490 [Actinomycetota bacterium]|nr:hypothetical protein [Actinomycetota bacterium]